MRGIMHIQANIMPIHTCNNTYIQTRFPNNHDREVESVSKAARLPRSLSVSAAAIMPSSSSSSSPLFFKNRAPGNLSMISLPPLPPGKKRHSSKTKWALFGGGPFRGCMVVGGNSSPVLPSCVPVDTSGFNNFRSSTIPIPIPIPIQRRFATTTGIIGYSSCPDDDAHFQEGISHMNNLSRFLSDSNRKLTTNAPPSTLGAVGLALHYANLIVVTEKLAASPHLIGPDARDDLYDMLTTSIRAALRARLKTYAKNLASFVYDPLLAAEWSEAISRILDWLSPLAHNMIRWQSDRNFEQQHLVSNPNVLLIQTLYFANQTKTEAAITELLVGLNYLWRFGRELNARAILGCMSNKNFDDGLDF